MKHKVKIIILSALGVLLVGSSVAYAYSQKGTLISQKTEELPDGNIYVEELYEIDQKQRGWRIDTTSPLHGESC